MITSNLPKQQFALNDTHLSFSCAGIPVSSSDCPLMGQKRAQVCIARIELSFWKPAFGVKVVGAIVPEFVATSKQ